MRPIAQLACAATLLALPIPAVAQITLPAILSDHVVLQAEAPVPIWGLSSADAEVTVTFAGQTVKTHSDTSGHWLLRLAPMHPNQLAATLTVAQTAPASPEAPAVTIRDVLVGEVWLAGGQSNMAFGLNAMQGSQPYIASADNPQLRLFTVRHNTAAQHLGLRPGDLPGDVAGRWELSTPASAAPFSAVAFLCGSEVQKSLHRPVGMISSNWGGTPIQTWMSRDAFLRDLLLARYVSQYDKAAELHAALAADPSREAAYLAEWKTWRTEVGEKLDADMKLYNDAVNNGKEPGPKPKASRPEPQNPDVTGIPLGGYRPSSPGVSWNAMLAPLVPLAVKGALWYQGEANVGQYQEYGLLLRTMISDWRAKFENPALDFLVVQLPANGPNDGRRNLAHLREAQASVESMPHTGLAVTFDVGDPGNVHPASKVDLAHRLALVALGEAYQQPVPYTGPVFGSAVPEGNTLRVTFSHVSGKLVIAQTPWLSVHTVPFPTDGLIGFEIAGQDGIFHPASATITGNSVRLSAEEVPRPRFVHYAFDESPRANLYDSAGLPAAPFRTDSAEHDPH